MSNTPDQKIREIRGKVGAGEAMHLYSPESIKALITEARANERQAVLDALPAKQSVPVGDLTTVGSQVRHRALGYNKAISEMQSAIKLKENN